MKLVEVLKLRKHGMNTFLCMVNFERYEKCRPYLEGRKATVKDFPVKNSNWIASGLLITTEICCDNL